MATESTWIETKKGAKLSKKARLFSPKFIVVEGKVHAAVVVLSVLFCSRDL